MEALHWRAILGPVLILQALYTHQPVVPHSISRRNLQDVMIEYIIAVIDDQFIKSLKGLATKS